MWVIRARETGDVIEEVSSREEAEDVLARYESQDKKDNIYEPNFYEIAEK